MSCSLSSSSSPATLVLPLALAVLDIGSVEPGLTVRQSTSAICRGLTICITYCEGPTWAILDGESGLCDGMG